jgi:predicted dithiol-disulfide oxidoreductase (DUF899 family)
MFGPKYTAGCPICSAAADTFDGAVAHLKARDVTFPCVSRAPLEKLQSYKRRMGCTTSCSTGRRRDGSTTFEPSATTSTRRTPPNREHARV